LQFFDPFRTDLARQPAVINWLSGEIGFEWIEKLQSAVGEAEASM